MKRVFLLFSLMALSAVAAFGQQPVNAAKNYFPDAPLIDQDGKTHRFYSDLLDGKTVIIASFHSDCTSIGPLMMRNMAKIQEALVGRAREFNVIWMSVDPTDTPAKSKAFAAAYKPGPNWYFLTGDKTNMEAVLKKLGMYVENKDDHTSILIIGNIKTGLWKKAVGLAKPNELQMVIESVLDDGKK
jgi:protein SCO1/2